MDGVVHWQMRYCRGRDNNRTTSWITPRGIFCPDTVPRCKQFFEELLGHIFSTTLRSMFWLLPENFSGTSESTLSTTWQLRESSFWSARPGNKLPNVLGTNLDTFGERSADFGFASLLGFTSVRSADTDILVWFISRFHAFGKASRILHNVYLLPYCWVHLNLNAFSCEGTKERQKKLAMAKKKGKRHNRNVHQQSRKNKSMEKSEDEGLNDLDESLGNCIVNIQNVGFWAQL